MLAIALTAPHQHLQVIDVEHALQPLRPCHRGVARGHGLIGGLCLASATSGRGARLTQSMISREHPFGAGFRLSHNAGAAVIKPLT